jgi:phosphoribosylamine--glycine ligase
MANHMNKQNILIVGGGGREHAIGWKLAQSPRAGMLYFAPGNAGTATLGTNVPISATDISGLLDFVKEKNIDLTLAIPDDPLALGIVDTFQAAGLRIFGPTQAAAQLESSKAFSKQFMQRHGLPTARFEIFTDATLAQGYLDMHSIPVVVKVSGLALGKGVFICQTLNEARAAVNEILVEKKFGEAGREVVIEDFLTGPEISTHAFSDGVTYAAFPTAQDHKRIGEGNTGPNTGGMGTISPLPFVTSELFKTIEQTIIAPTLTAMQSDGMPFSGVLYPGLMLTPDGPKLLEYNARFGDPETQTYMRLLETDLLDIVEACVDKKLSDLNIIWKKGAAATVVLASGGYPNAYEKGKIISGIAEAEQQKDVVVFQAGTTMKDGALVTNGGRVLGVSAVGETLDQALTKAYEAIEKISFEGMYFRKDIGIEYR